MTPLLHFQAEKNHWTPCSKIVGSYMWPKPNQAPPIYLKRSSHKTYVFLVIRFDWESWTRTTTTVIPESISESFTSVKDTGIWSSRMTAKPYLITHDQDPRVRNRNYYQKIIKKNFCWRDFEGWCIFETTKKLKLNRHIWR